VDAHLDVCFDRQAITGVWGTIKGRNKIFNGNWRELKPTALQLQEPQKELKMNIKLFVISLGLCSCSSACGSVPNRSTAVPH
jgi:hypothetical protein